MKHILLAIFAAIILIFATSCAQHGKITNTQHVPDTLYANIDASGSQLVIALNQGAKHNHPTFAFWLEDLEGNFLQTLFVTRYLATGIYGHGDAGQGEWKRTEGEAIRPATLPYWLHKRNIENPGQALLPTPEQPVADAYTGATPKSDFILVAKTDKKIPKKFRLLMEINQPWDWNDYWTTLKYPDEPNYNPSAQPSLVYAVTIDTDCENCEYFLNPIGHGHYSGKNGKLYTDLRTFTTAFNIVESVRLKSLKQ
jgi:hypothetical protein